MALIKCNECGKDISDTAKTCIHCGSPISKTIVCSECDKENDFRDKVCKNCGNKLHSRGRKINLLNKKYIIPLIVIVIIIIIILVTCLFNNKKIDLQEVYDASGCDSYYCELSKDKSYLEIDTNPLDLDDYSSSVAFDYVEKVNVELGFTEALFKKMGKTRVLDGTLSDENDLVKVTWTYHPDNGFEVTYSIK